MEKTFLVLLAIFVIVTIFYFLDFYVFNFFEVKNPYTRETIHTFQLVWGLFGLAIGIYAIYLMGYIKGRNEGYEEGLEEGSKKAFNGS